MTGLTFFILTRKIFESDIWRDDPHILKLFIYLVGNARFDKKPKKYPDFEIKRGELLTSLSNIADDNEYMFNGQVQKWSRQKVSRMIDVLIKRGMIRKIADTYGTHISICNYNTYQDVSLYGADSFGTALERECYEGVTGMDIINKDNNGNKDKKERIYTFPEQILMKISKPEKVWKEYHLQHIPVTLHNETFILNWVDWIDHLISKKKKPTENAAKRQLEKLSKVDDPNLWLNTAIEHGWQGLFPPPETKVIKPTSEPAWMK